MRLLQLEENGAFSLVEYVGRDIPPYAILSHTWGADDEEVTLKNLTEGTSKTKAGYRKLTFCGKQAANDGLQFFWVDTCCIDKSSSAELTEAINSMFQWYYEADKCYVYLSDVSISGFAKNDQSFQECRWFTRGWTLQELIAPTSVEFFSSDGERIGDKNSMVQEIHNITGIPIQALRKTPLSHFSIDERMLWAKRRKTKREEDAAYSLLGIFDTHMPLLYGEGREKAFYRLRREIEESSRYRLPIMSRSLASEGAEIEEVEDIDKYRIPFSLKSVPVGKFADRPRDREALEQALLPQKQERRRRIIVAYGLGGAGKTQLAADFARRHQHSFSSVLWLDGSSESSLKQTIAAYASRIPVGQVAGSNMMYASGQGGELDTVVRDVLRWLSIPGNNGWLVVVDNVDRDYRRQEEDAEAYKVEDYLPEADHGLVLITTRLPHLGQLGERWEVKKVDEERARAIFEAWYGREIGHAGNELMGLLDGLPLALAQAAAYMSETGMSFVTYTRLYKEQWTELMEPHNQRHLPLRSYSNGSVATTWMISYTAIRKRNWAAANLLLLWAHLDNRSLWHGLLAAASQKSATAAKRTSVWLGEIARSEIEFIKAIGMLRSYSLVEEMDDQMGYAMHPVVHQWALHIQNEGQRAALSWAAIIAVGLAVPMSNTKKYWEMQVRLLPHAERCEKKIEEAINYQFEECGFKTQEEEGEGKRILLWAVHDLAMLYVERGKLDKAEKMYIIGLEGKEKLLGTEHRSTLRTVQSLGVLFRDQGKLEKAEEMSVRALEGYEKALGAEHTSTLKAVHNLGILLRDQGKLDKAENMYTRALGGYKKTLGVEHTSTLNVFHNLGLLYADQGRLDEAEEMYMQALEGNEKALGADHTWTLKTVNNIGLLNKDRGRLDKAEKMYMRAFKGYEKTVGADHALTLSTVSNLAALYAERQELDKAEQMYVHALEGHKKALGADHMWTLNTVHNLGTFYAERGELDKAEKMYMQTLEGYKKALGADHMWTLNTVSNLGGLYVDRGKLDEAEKMYMQALEGYKKTLGQENMTSSIPALNAMWGLASLFELQNRAEDARTFYSKALLGYRKVVGDDHARCQTLRENLATLATERDKIRTASENG